MNPAHAARASATPEHRIVLRFDPQQISVKDVIDGAWFSGELDAAWEALLAGIGAEQLALDQELDSDDKVLQSQSEEFRYEHDLLTSEETEKWLSDRDLSEDDFVNFFLRRYWRQKLGPTSVHKPNSYPEADPELKDALRADLWLSGEFDRLASRLMRRVVSLARVTAAGLDENELSEERSRFLQRHQLAEDSFAKTLQALARHSAWVETSLAGEIAYRQILDRLLNHEQRCRELRSRRLGLTRVEMETLLFRTADAAREALLCLREEETSIEELAYECGSASARRRVFIEDCADQVQNALAPAAPGDCLILEETKESFAVCRVIEKSEPHLEDAEVRARIDSKLLEAGFAELAGKNIRWLAAGISSR